MGATAFQFAQTPYRPVFAGARISISLRAYDPDSLALSASARLPRAMAAIERAGYKVKYRVVDTAGLVTPSLFIEGNAMVSRKSVSDVAQEMIDLLRRGGLAVSGGKGVLYAPGKKRGRRAGLLVSGLLDASNTFGDVPINWTLMAASDKQAYINANLDVRALQSALNAQPSSLPPLAVDGAYGSKTRARVKEFQSRNFLTQTGNVDPDTFRLLGGPAKTGASQVVPPAPSPTPTPAPTAVAVLRGSVVDAVITVGQAWRVLSYTSNLKRQLIDKLNVSGFLAASVDDSNISLLTGGTLRVRAQVNSDGYSNANDAAKAIMGFAADVGYNATDATGQLVSGPNTPLGPGGNPLGDSGLGTILLLVGGLAVGGIVLSKLANR